MPPSATDSRRQRTTTNIPSGRRENGGSEQSGYASSPYNNVGGYSRDEYPVADYAPSASSTTNGRSSMYGGDGGTRRDMRQAANSSEAVYIVDEGPIAGLPHQNSTGNHGRSWGGPTNPELTTSYMDYRYDAGAIGDLYTVPGSPRSMPRTSRYQERDVGYSSRAPEYFPPHTQRDDRRRGSSLGDGIWTDQNGSASASEFFAERFDTRQQGAASHTSTGFEYYDPYYPRRPRRDFPAETYVNGNVESHYARTPPSRRRRRDSSDRG